MLKEQYIPALLRLITEAKKKVKKHNLKGKVDAEGKTLGHVRDYVLPYLSKEGRKKTVSGLKSLGAVRGDTAVDGEKHNAKASSTHELASDHGELKAGTRVKITHVSAGGDDGRNLFAHTSHGKIPLSKIRKPEEIRVTKKPKGRAGFGVEGKLSKNLGTKAAGSSATGFDFHYTGGKNKSGKKQPDVRGKVRHVESNKKAVKGADRPDVRGESKLTLGKFGQSVASFEGGKWAFRNKSKMNPKFEQATVTGSDGKERTLLNHLNHFHKNGKVAKGFRAKAARGTAAHYLASSEINALHIHHRKVDKRGRATVDHGTTYTVGNTSLKGKTKLSHLGHKELARLDGAINVEASGAGRVSITHRVNQGVMKEYAGAAHGENSGDHRDLTNPEHAAEFKKHIDAHIAEYEKSGGKKKKKKKTVNEEAPVNVAPTAADSGNIQGYDPVMLRSALRRHKLKKQLKESKDKLRDKLKGPLSGKPKKLKPLTPKKPEPLKYRLERINKRGAGSPGAVKIKDWLADKKRRKEEYKKEREERMKNRERRDENT